MTSAEIRDELLSQHAALRGRLEAARLAVIRWASGEAPQARVREELAEACQLRDDDLAIDAQAG